ncbi:MAG: multicopper oxidase domain-containing protein, partial [Myxococcaceae bacterium]|nr:multicopper oxidase domain-containing protein [Myxococcaceae bacterium]
DCIEVTLINAFPEKMPRTPHWNFLPVITERFNVNQVRSSNHAALHPQLVEYDVRQSDGANIGLNPVQTVAPGKSITYRWFAGRWVLKDDPGPVTFPLQPVVQLASGGSGGDLFEAQAVEYGAVSLRDVADVVNHGMHGGIGALIIEPPGSTWKTDEGTDASATVTYTDSVGAQRRFREFVLLYQDEIGLHSDKEKFQCVDERLNCGTALLTYGAVEDPEESGHKGFNYRTEPLWARVGIPPEKALEVLNDIDNSKLLDSDRFGDPETPVFEAEQGQEVRFRVVQPSGHPRVHAFHLHGHEWQHDAWATGTDSRIIGENETSNIIGVQGGQGPMRHWNILPLYGAGGAFEVRGDFLYRDQTSVQFPDGLWGIFRVK